MAITQTVDIPVNRRLVIEVPCEVPSGKTILTYTPVASTLEPDYVGECPECAKYRDPETGELRFNTVSLAAFEETKAIIRGDKPARRYKPQEFKEACKDLLSE